MRSFLAELRTQRWDDHRYYHHSRINQSLHLLSAVSFIVAYVTAFTDPAKSALIGWLVSMVSRQSGHFFFEPKGYDAVNHATHEHKEEIKVGYNLSETGHDTQVSFLTGKAQSNRANLTTSKTYYQQSDYRFDMKTFTELRNAQSVTIAYDGLNPMPPMFCYLKPYFNDPNKSYFRQAADGEL